MTLAQAKQICKDLGFSLKRNQYGEYILRNGETEYFGGSIDDAVETAKAITGHDVERCCGTGLPPSE